MSGVCAELGVERSVRDRLYGERVEVNATADDGQVSRAREAALRFALPKLSGRVRVGLSDARASSIPVVCLVAVRAPALVENQHSQPALLVLVHCRSGR